MRPLVVLLSAGCATNEASAPAPLELEMVEEGRAFGGSPDAPPAAPPADGTALSIVTGSAKPKLRDAGPGASDALLGALDYAQADAPEPEPASDPAPARSWFPEAFLWRPLVETGEDGVAELDVRVPDQLSTFRVLALAHDRRGQQAGATAALQTRLPLYVDPVTPDRLYRGDRIELPVQVVNGSPDGLTASLTVEASGALRGVGTTRLALSAGGSDVRRISLLAARPGAATVRAEVRSGVLDDAAERAIVVLPSGRPVVETVARRLTSEPFTLTGPSAADAASEHIEVVVFGGPWSVLQSEIERLAAGARPIDPAYGFALSAYVTDLAEATGVELDADRQKLLRIHAWQRLAAIARSPTPAQAVDFLASLRRVEGDELVDALVPQLIRQVKRAQRADGTWSTADRSTLQQVLVQ
ncbi:MAG: alpha-2-macroglobulin family protein, partial [Myxococcota bacterium]